MLFCKINKIKTIIYSESWQVIRVIWPKTEISFPCVLAPIADVTFGSLPSVIGYRYSN
jgi:hypothetical protein